MLKIEARWQGQPGCFGSPYICAIGDTVTGGAQGRGVALGASWQQPGHPFTLRLLPHSAGAGEKGTEGSLEYLVYSTPFVAVAAQYGLRPVLQYDCPPLDDLLDPVRALLRPPCWCFCLLRDMPGAAPAGQKKDHSCMYPSD